MTTPMYFVGSVPESQPITRSAEAEPIYDFFVYKTLGDAVNAARVEDGIPLVLAFASGAQVLLDVEVDASFRLPQPFLLQSRVGEPPKLNVLRLGDFLGPQTIRDESDKALRIVELRAAHEDASSAHLDSITIT